MGRSIELTAADGFRLAAYRADPAGAPRGVLVVAQEIFGVNGHIRAVCDGFAEDGLIAIAPALFDRYERNVDIGYTQADIARGRELKGRAQLDAAMLDVAAAHDAVPGVRPFAVIGYCWGGFVAWMAASRLADLACVVAYYGGGMLDALGERPQCPVMAHFGERDAMLPVAGVHRADGRAPGRPGPHLRRRPRIQLRPAAILRRRGRKARARAHAAVPSAPPGLTRATAGPTSRSPRIPARPRRSWQRARRARRSPRDRTTAPVRRSARSCPKRVRSPAGPASAPGRARGRGS